MRFVMFYHSVVSDWNHGNAHFLRGVILELMDRGHRVMVFEPRDGWSLTNLMADSGHGAIEAFHRAYPNIESYFYDLGDLDLDSALEGADVVLVHEWNSPQLIARLGEYRARHRGLCLFFHDTHHRAVTAPEAMRGFQLSAYDGVLAFGSVIRDLYLRSGWTGRGWTWHEAADPRVFGPLGAVHRDLDLVWIGNWGDGERTAELEEFLVQPVRELGLKAAAYGVRYPRAARAALAAAGIEYRGFLPNFQVPRALASARVTVHIPRRPYVQALPGIPTIRPFEAMACGIPLISAPWSDSEKLFTAGRDFLIASDGAEMRHHIQAVLSDRTLALQLSEHARATILARHTCAHRVDQLLAIIAQLNGPTARKELAA